MVQVVLKAARQSMLGFAASLLALTAVDTAEAAGEGRRAEPAAIEAFLDRAAAEHGVDRGKARAWLAEADYRQSIIDAISRPAEGKPWRDYRPIFLTPDRLAAGRAFMAKEGARLAAAEAKTGVPAEIVASIIGIETFYGRITGKYRVLDALYTLGFFYPPRAEFFAGELAQFFALIDEEGLTADQALGSYAGAMGWGQFIPSSYRAYARDGDGDGRRNLFTNIDDIVASVANYFVAHDWRPGEPIAVPAVRSAGALDFEPEDLTARYSLLELAERGYRPREAVGHDYPATLIKLEGDAGPEYWITFHNFYVISRYNRSKLYSMAVTQFSQQLRGSRSAASAAR